jgi:RNA polymerase sigma factor (sigma-70 family)
VAGESGHLSVVPSDGDDSNDERRFEDLYREHFQAIYAYFLRRVSLVDVPDLVSDVFATAWRRIVDIPPPPDGKLWLYGVAQRVLAQHHRGRRRRENLLSKMRHNAASLDRHSDEHPHLHSLDLIDRLNPKERELVRLVVWDQLSHAEVAAILGCSANAVGIRYHRSLERLRRDLTLSGDARPGSSRRDRRRARTEGTP